VRDFNNFETRAVINFFFSPLQGKTPKEIQAILTETLACFLPGQAKDLSAPLYIFFRVWPVNQSRKLGVALCHKMFADPCSTSKFRRRALLPSNGEVNIGHENTTMVVWIYGGV